MGTRPDAAPEELRHRLGALSTVVGS
jgi:hypothetical protein